MGVAAVDLPLVDEADWAAAAAAAAANKFWLELFPAAAAAATTEARLAAVRWLVGAAVPVPVSTRFMSSPEHWNTSM